MVVEDTLELDKVDPMNWECSDLYKRYRVQWEEYPGRFAIERGRGNAKNDLKNLLTSNLPTYNFIGVQLDVLV